ncbi:MAG: alpha/beta hydrolase [Traorella sp.]
MAKLTCNFISYTLHRAVDFTLILPSLTFPEEKTNDKLLTHAHKPYPVLYLLHGYGNNHMTWNGYTRIELFCEERKMAVVMFSADNKMYLDHGNDDNYFSFMDELQEFVENNFNVSTRKEDRYIAGLSMGGYGTLLHGLTHPEKYQAMGIFSGLTSPQDKKMIQPSTLLKKLIKEKKEICDMYITIGDQDFLCPMNQKFDKLLTRYKVKHTFEIVEGYAHEWRFWDMKVEEFLDWIKRSDAYANTKVNV